MAKFIKHKSEYINVDNITHFHTKVVVKYLTRHEIVEEDLYRFKLQEHCEVQAYAIHIYFVGDTYDDLKIYFDREDEINNFVKSMS